MLKSSEMHLVLVAPRIPANVASVARTAMALGAKLHLVGPFGFRLDEKSMARASVGYFKEVDYQTYIDFDDFWKSAPVASYIFVTKRGDFDYSEISYSPPLCLVFGNEEEGVPPEFWEVPGAQKFVSCRIPTVSVRCLNLAVAVGILGFEVQRQWRLQRKIEGVG
ncbi:MAG: tRNA (uridine(34)/cytosine(34)/5-carboxymethylaminomethyluridine(34)-2'-O)-methyltransferase TrmL [Bradymonadales bacterium]|nr:MAG: tRNA (uridine(34)/cytosine(34)/5-carboxymethylaminomethyluridine(34)-2'-O)-methyltransferase TrmL [Bradymonadales bacterium]